MEHRLLCAQKALSSNEKASWSVAGGHRKGVPIHLEDVLDMKGIMFTVRYDTLMFLTNLMTDGGVWDGWYCFPCTVSTGD